MIRLKTASTLLLTIVEIIRRKTAPKLFLTIGEIIMLRSLIQDQDIDYQDCEHQALVFVDKLETCLDMCSKNNSTETEVPLNIYQRRRVTRLMLCAFANSANDNDCAAELARKVDSFKKNGAPYCTKHAVDC